MNADAFANQQISTDAHDLGGYYALAGFFFQFIGSAESQLEILDKPTGRESWFVLEHIGQDAAILPKNGAKPTLIQYKYSAVEAIIEPSEMINILKGFLKSGSKQDSDLGACDFRLVTNRIKSPMLAKWPSTADALADKLKKSLGLNMAVQLASIHSRLDYRLTSLHELRSEIESKAASYGVLPEEMDDCVDRINGLLFRIAQQTNSRIISRVELLHKLTNIRFPLALKSADSVKRQKLPIEAHRAAAVEAGKVLPREVCREILDSAASNSITVVVGRGGCGKSIAVADALLHCLSNPNSSPGYCLILRPEDSRREGICKAISEWRGENNFENDPSLQKPLSRLERCHSIEPILVVCIDAIDESHSETNLQARLRSFWQEVQALNNYTSPTNAPLRVSLIIVCRHISEFKEFSMIGPPPPHKPISVTDYSKSELAEAVRTSDLPDSIRHRFHATVDCNFEEAEPLSRSFEEVDSRCLSILRNPLIWRLFLELQDENTQMECLSDARRLSCLGERYLQWFNRKTRLRMNGLQRYDVEYALREVAQRLMRNHKEALASSEDWNQACKEAGLQPNIARQLFSEACSAGLIEPEQENGRTWRWMHPWFLQYLLEVK